MKDWEACCNQFLEAMLSYDNFCKGKIMQKTMQKNMMVNETYHLVKGSSYTIMHCQPFLKGQWKLVGETFPIVISNLVLETMENLEKSNNTYYIITIILG